MAENWNNGDRRNCPLLGTSSVNRYCSNEQVHDNRRAVGDRVFYAVCPEAI
jgi:hypothetical protein